MNGPIDVNGDYVGLLRASLDHCVKCTICETQCPVAAVTGLFPGPKAVGPQAERFRQGRTIDPLVDYCSSCGVCTLVCPQGVKVAELNHLARTAMKQQRGIGLRDRLISNTTAMGAVMTPVAALANRALANRPLRIAIEKTVGVHRDAPMPVADGRRFERWFAARPKPSRAPTRGPLIYFHGCAGEYFETRTSIEAVEVLEFLGFEVVVPDQGCCGLAAASNGLYAQARRSVRSLARALAGPDTVPVVGASGSCVGMLKHEAAEVLGVRDAGFEATSVRVRDLCEFLLDLHDAGQLPTPTVPIELTVPYHAPCQVRSTGIGTPAVHLLRLIPGVRVVESSAPCCGIAGTYGLKAEKYAIAQDVGAPLFEMVRAAAGDQPGAVAACDTETCRWQIQAGSGVPTVHPVHLLHRAYGLAGSGSPRSVE